MTDPLIDPTPDVVAIVRAVLDELADRIGGVSEGDELAMATAVQKATMRGFRQGVAVARFEIQSRGVLREDVRFSMDVSDAEPDLWAERYGQDP